MEKFLKNFEIIRKKKGLSQEYVATRIGITQQSLSHKLNDQKDIKLGFMRQLCSAIDEELLDVLTYPVRYVPVDNVPEDKGCQDCKKKDITIQNLNNYIIRLEHERDALTERVKNLEVK